MLHLPDHKASLSRMPQSYRMRWRSGNNVDLYYWRIRFISRPKNRCFSVPLSKCWDTTSFRSRYFPSKSFPLHLLPHNSTLESLYNNWLTLWSWALHEKPPIVQLLKNFSTFYGTRRFITVHYPILRQIDPFHTTPPISLRASLFSSPTYVLVLIVLSFLLVS
jgi:hypothetical protein